MVAFACGWLPTTSGTRVRPWLTRHTTPASILQVNIIRDYSLRGDIAAETGENPDSITEVRSSLPCARVL